MRKMKEDLAGSDEETEELEKRVSNLEKSEAQAPEKILQFKTSLDATQMTQDMFKAFFSDNELQCNWGHQRPWQKKKKLSIYLDVEFHHF